MRLAIACASFVVLAAGCGSAESDQPAKSSPAAATDAKPTGSIDAPGASVPELRGLTFGAAKGRLRTLSMTWRWIRIQEVETRAEDLVVCRQEPAPGAAGAKQATLALAESCDVELPKLTGMAVGEATELLDANKIVWGLEDGVDIDFPAPLDSAPPDWHVCGGDAGFAVEDAVGFLSSGDSSTGILYGDGESVNVFLQVAPDAASCYTTNDDEEP